MHLSKPQRVKDEAFLAFLRGEPCITCYAPAPSDPSHLRTRGSGGSDYTAASQCRACHQQWHQLGPVKFGFVTETTPWREQSEQVVRYLTDPVVTLRRAADWLDGQVGQSLTPEATAQLRRIVVLAERAK